MGAAASVGVVGCSNIADGDRVVMTPLLLLFAGTIVGGFLSKILDGGGGGGFIGVSEFFSSSSTDNTSFSIAIPGGIVVIVTF